MNSLNNPTIDRSERRDLLLEDAFLQATDSTIVAPNILQRALFPRLSTQDSGLLVQTGPGAGRLEAVFVPVMSTSHIDDVLHRLYIIAPDNCLLDDYLYRLVPYMRALSAARGIPITLFIDEQSPFCRTYLSDGTFSDDLYQHPLDPRVDLVVAHFSSFRSLFFGAGGVHALPGALEHIDELDINLAARRRDLFYFDEAQSYVREEFTGFVRLVEFLYAEDLDIVVGTTTLPEACHEELSFLEDLVLQSGPYQPPRVISAIPAAKDKETDIIVDLIKNKYFESSRAGVVRETVSDTEDCYRRLSALYPQLVFCYHSGQTNMERIKTYALLRELEKEGEGYLLVCDGKALEGADIDVNLMIMSVCTPESLILRAGRCNRRGDLQNGEIIIVGSTYSGRALPDIGRFAYLDALAGCTEKTRFEVADWNKFIV
jgi:CRISPR-associated endonuclease/helicase Cas3